MPNTLMLGDLVCCFFAAIIEFNDTFRLFLGIIYCVSLIFLSFFVYNTGKCCNFAHEKREY